MLNVAKHLQLALPPREFEILRFVQHDEFLTPSNTRRRATVAQKVGIATPTKTTMLPRSLETQ